MSIKAKIAAELAERVKGGDSLAMDYASRMQRAKEQGFDRTVYHKTWGENFGDGSGFKSFSKDKMQETDYGFAGKGVYATEQPLGGTAYGDTTMKLMTNVKNPYKVKAENPDSLDPYDWIDKNADNYSSMEDASAAYTNMMKAKGYDSIIDESAGGEVVVFDPSNIRSVNAAFDPAKKDSSNLLASIGAGTVVGGAALGSDDAEAGVISKTLAKKYPDVDFWLNEKNDRAVLDKVIVPESARGSGLGTAFMNDLVSLANTEGKTLALTPSSDFGGNKKRLEKFYKGFGFNPNKGRNKDYEYRETMIKTPNDLRDLGAGLAATGGLSSLLSQGGEPLTGVAYAPKSETMASLSNLLQSVETPMGYPFGGLAEYINKLNYGDEIGWLDRLGAIPDPYEFSKVFE